MLDRIKLPMKFDIARLKADLDKVKSKEWIEHFVKRNFDGDWSVIPLRGKAGATHPVMMIYSDASCTEFENTPYLEGTNYFTEVFNAFQCPLNSVRLMKLTPGSKILEHFDFDLNADEGNARLHLAIETNPDVDFRLNGERVLLEEGDCWYLRLSDPHSVANRGESNRIHLVLDVTVNPWLLEMLNSAA